MIDEVGGDMGRWLGHVGARRHVADEHARMHVHVCKQGTMQSNELALYTAADSSAYGKTAP